MNDKSSPYKQSIKDAMLEVEVNLVKAGLIPEQKTNIDKKARLSHHNLEGIKIEKDPSGKNPHELGAKVDAGKNRVWLCLAGFSNAIEEVSKITTVGANKYTPNGWCYVENGVDRYMDAFGRHMLALGQGEKYDNGEGGTGGLHKAQMIWNLLASLELELREEKKNATRKA